MRFICKYCGTEFERDDSNAKYCSHKCYVEAKKAGDVRCERHGFKTDITGQRFGMLTAIEPTENRICGRVAWLCKCDCGNMCEKSASQLKNGHVKSCGNHSSEMTANKNYTHKMTHTRLHGIWSGMKTRCSNTRRSTARYYVERGIRVCEEWKSDFMKFYEWATSNGYRDDLTLDRIDNDKGYSPDNCRWATYHEQRLNQRRSKPGELQTV